MKKGVRAFLIAVILSAYIVPYTVLSSVTAWYGSFLFWGIAGLATIGACTLLTMDWGKRHE